MIRTLTAGLKHTRPSSVESIRHQPALPASPYIVWISQQTQILPINQAISFQPCLYFTLLSRIRMSRIILSSSLKFAECRIHAVQV